MNWCLASGDLASGQMKPTFIALLALCLCLSAIGAGRKQPDIILILADDAGYSDFGCYGGEIETPTLDKLAALLKASKEKLTVGFSGADAAVCQVPVVELAKRGALQNATVDDQCGRGDYAITVSPIPDVR